MDSKEAKDRLISLKMSYKIRIEEEDIEALEQGIKALENQKMGHWIKIDMDIYECSECHKGLAFFEKENYCSHCGAKMERE